MKLHEIFLLVGSNIQPDQNIRRALRLLQESVSIQAISPVWETPAVGSNGPNFLNLVVRITSQRTPQGLKYNVLRKIEEQLGRIRSADKNAPRPIDLDILMFDKKSLEPNIWLQAHIACPLSGLLPDLVDPSTGLNLSQLALNFQKTSPVHRRTDLLFGEFIM